MNKIKGQIDIDRVTLMCLCVIVLVGLGSFGLGRLSVSNGEDEKVLNRQDNRQVESSMKNVVSSVENVRDTLKERMYVASKNGKLYYTKDCSGAKRIAPKNEVWFATKEDAEQAGYSLSASCNK
ncbi:MAG: hypothetical protein WC241_04185 [Candidatus Paceibacterota bacterium]